MKNNLENSFKDSLQDFDMPYNPEAWKALSSKLDAKLPTTPKSNFKWYAIAGTVVVASVGAYFYLSGDGQNESQSVPKVVQTTTQNQEKIDGIDQKSENPSDGNSTVDNVVNPTNGNSISNNANGNTPQNVAVNGNSNVNNPGQENNNPNNNQSNANSTENSNSGNSQLPTHEQKIKFNAPVIGQICANETVEIENKNDVKLWILGPNENDWHVKPQADGSFKTDIAGVYQLGYFDKQGFVESSKFTVKDAPFVDFEIDRDQKFDGGIPVTKVSTDIPGTEFLWNFGKTTATGRNAEAHFFMKGDYNITLTVTGANGCTNSKTEKIEVEFENGDRGNYNLLAVNAINLRSSDIRNSSFMPEGLKSRDVRFKMTIYSMDDGHKVFETKDATNPWRGVDQSNGQTVTHATTYYWEVIIENPLPGENSKYKGSLTVLLN